MNSENPPGNTRFTIEWIQEWAKSNDIPFRIQWYENNQANIILTVGNAQKDIVLCGHLDTVPLGDKKNWQYDPLGADEIDGFIYGRGSADMKGGVAACLAALKTLHENCDPETLIYNIVFLGTSDEEVGLSGAKHALKLGVMNNAEFLIVTEPTALNVGIAEKGVLWFNIQSFGKSAHGSTPEKGVNAIEELTKLFPLLHKNLPEISNPILGKSTLNIGKFEGGKSANVVPEKAEAHCDYRLVPPIIPEEYAEEIAKVIQNYSKSSPARFKGTPYQIMASISSSLDNPLVQEFIKTAQRSTNIGLNYGTDAAVLVSPGIKDVPFVIYGPGDPKAIHVANERVPISEVLEVESVLITFLKMVTRSSSAISS